jgi:hypothetical protein
MKRIAALFGSALLAACGAGGDLVVECGPLPSDECRDRTTTALLFVSENWPDKTVTRIEFRSDRGAYHVTFADGSQAGVMD